MYDNNLRQIKVILYRLKRIFGQTVIIRKTSSVSNDVTTGAITRAVTNTTVKRAIVLPQEMARDFVYDIAYLAANKNFTYGALFDKASRWVIIDVKELPSGFSFDLNAQIIFEDRLWEIKDVQKTSDNRGYLLRVVDTKARPNE